MKKSLLFVVTLLISFNLFAKVEVSGGGYQVGKYVVPQDSDVLQHINVIDQQVPLYPMNIKVLVWNMYKGLKLSWLEDFKDLTQGKDLLLLQEMFLDRKMIGAFKETKEFHYKTATSYMDAKNNMARTGVATAAKQSSQSIIWQRSYYREPVVRTPKMTLFAKYKLAGMKQKVLVGNIHAINFVSHKKFKHMLQEAAKVMSKHEGPAIFGGDFNTWSNKKMATMIRLMTKLGYSMVKFSVDYRKKFRGNILDHVWVKGLQVQSAIAPNRLGSDHNPMEIELGLF